MANQKIRQFVTNRALGCCEYCMSQEKYASQLFSIEHIYPSALGGDSDFETLHWLVKAVIILNSPN